jgi:hypothetical protein
MRREARGVGALIGALALWGGVWGSGCNAIVGAGDYSVGDAAAEGSSGGGSGGGSDAGSGGSSGGGSVGHDAGDANSGSSSGGDDAADESATGCTPVNVATVPAQGGAACPGTTDSATCFPHDTTSFTPTWVEPVGAHTGLCTAAQISDFYAACEDTTTSTTAGCDAFKTNAANAACFGCLYTDSTAHRYGAIINYSAVGLDHINVAGCIALVEPCNQRCAAALLAQLQCENAACTSCDTTVSLDDYNACSDEADQCSSCSGYATPPQCEAMLLGAQSAHPAVATCNINAANFHDFYMSVATLMCGP